MKQPKNCKCGKTAWHAQPQHPICKNYEPTFDDDFCINCYHDKACHEKKPPHERMRNDNTGSNEKRKAV